MVLDNGSDRIPDSIVFFPKFYTVLLEKMKLVYYTLL